MTTQKVAFAARIDGETLADSLGAAPKAVVVTVQDGREVRREVRDKPFHEHHDHAHHDEHAEHAEHDHHGEHGHHGGPGPSFAVITDCQALITRKIGPPGYSLARELGITLYVVQAQSVAEALQAYLAGELEAAQ